LGAGFVNSCVPTFATFGNDLDNVPLSGLLSDKMHSVSYKIKQIQNKGMLIKNG
jgi:hypothetical protein